jgi:hypothetical protein
MTLTLQIAPELEQALRATAERAGVSPDQYVLDLLRDQITSTNGGPTGLPAAESSLLERINEGLPDETWTRYEALKEKRDAETLTDAEHEELIRLSDEIEIWNARRLEAVAELAKLRGVPFPELVKQLGLGPRRHA